VLAFRIQAGTSQAYLMPGARSMATMPSPSHALTARCSGSRG
jgi:hypothetical protein